MLSIWSKGVVYRDFWKMEVTLSPCSLAREDGSSCRHARDWRKWGRDQAYLAWGLSLLKLGRD